MMKKNLRLDDLVSEFTLMLVELIEQILDTKLILSIPFLFLLIHSTINFRPLAVTKSTIKSLLQGISRISIKYWYILEEAQNQEEEGNFQDDSPDQVIILQKLTLIFSIDIIEKLTAISSLHGELFIQEIWHDDIIPMELLQRCLPENSERFKNTSQINLVYNIVEILMSSITELSMAYSSGPKRQQLSIFNSLLKVLLIDIPLKDDFMFYGLNRIIGNNIDIRKVESVVPIDETPIGLTMISIPSPIPYELLQERVQENQNCTKNGSQINKSKSRLLFDLSLKHQNHLLNLRIRVTTLLEHYILTTEQIDSLQLKDFIKSMVRTIGFEQSNILKNPRSKNVHLRTQIIANLVRILNYISSEAKGGITTLVYPETLYEIFVTLLRIAFGSNSLSSDARQVIESIRNNVKYFETPIFNKWCEIRSKQLNHIDNTEGGDGKFISEIESQYANGLEFPYEEETIELAREILDLCVTHEEADNLYFNMNCEDAKNNDGEGDEEDEENFDEMDLVQ